MNKNVSNCISVDVESFVEANVQSFDVPQEFRDPGRAVREIERNMDAVLNLFEMCGVRGTFFFLGRIARDQPNLVRSAADEGHEIACHGMWHTRLFDLPPETFRSGLRDAKAMLEDVAGVRVHGFRAPDFSITTRSLWALDVLQEEGFSYDSSIYPTAIHDVYGLPDAPSEIHVLSNGLVEFPLPTVRLLGHRLPFGGGGYFRLYAIAFTRLLISWSNRSGRPVMCYIHPYEVGPEIPRLPGLSAVRRFRHYFNCDRGYERLERLLRSFRFAPAAEILASHGLLAA